jgi:hypothetical protein
MSLFRPVAALAVCLSAFAIGCAAPAEDAGASDGNSAYSGDQTSTDTRPFTFFLSLDDDTPQKQLVTARERMTITARDPNPAEVDAQSDMGGATVTIGTLAIKDVSSPKATPFDVEVRYAGKGALTVVRPSASDIARVMKSGRYYEVSATRSHETTSTFFSEVDLTFTIE